MATGRWALNADQEERFQFPVISADDNTVKYG
jgi:hypothetical protein